MKQQKKKWKTLFWVFLSILTAMIVFYFLNLQALRQVNRNTAASFLKQIGLCIYIYCDKNGSFPEFFSEDKQIETWSWRVLVASTFSSSQESEQIQYQHPWDSNHNAGILKCLSKQYNSYFSSRKQDQKSGLASYVAVKGKGTVWTETNLGNILEPIKSHPDMIVAIELPYSKNFWAEPGDDITPEEVIELFQKDGGLVYCSKQSIFSRDHWPKYFLTLNGQVHSFGSIKSVEELEKLLIISE